MQLLFDRGRATRPGATASLDPLFSLQKEAGKKNGSLPPRVHLWQSPSLRGSPLRHVSRWSELLGVFHGKTAVSVNAVILSGANLSESYFTTRKDRYVMIRSQPVADFYFRLLETIAELSYLANG